MKGSNTVHFSALFADTVCTHGVVWAEQYYVRKHGMPKWEFGIWLANIIIKA